MFAKKWNHEQWWCPRPDHSINQQIIQALGNMSTVIYAIYCWYHCLGARETEQFIYGDDPKFGWCQNVESRCSSIACSSSRWCWNSSELLMQTSCSWVAIYHNLASSNQNQSQFSWQIPGLCPSSTPRGKGSLRLRGQTDLIPEGLAHLGRFQP